MRRRRCFFSVVDVAFLPLQRGNVKRRKKKKKKKKKTHNEENKHNNNQKANKYKRKIR